MTIQENRLANGLTVITDRMETVETVSMGAWVDVGTRDEQPDVNGVSHLLEHMAFKGTERRDAYAIAAEIEAVGGHLNAYTSREHTAYYAKVLKDNLPLAVDLIGDILQHSVMNAEELAREQAERFRSPRRRRFFRRRQTRASRGRPVSQSSGSSKRRIFRYR